MSPEAQQKLARLQELLAEKARIDREIEEILGAAPEPVQAPAPAFKNKGGRKKGERPTCSQCGKVGHNITQCPDARGKHPNNPAPKPSAFTEGKPCCGSIGPRHKKGCSSAGYNFERFSPDEKPAAKSSSSEPLTSDQYDELRDAMFDRDFMSAKYALTHKLSPREVNKAIESVSYEQYLEDR